MVGGCLYPEPDLLGFQAAALLIFQGVADAWERSEMSGELGLFRMDLARIEAEGHGFVWDGDLQASVHQVAAWFKAETKRRWKKEPVN